MSTAVASRGNLGNVRRHRAAPNSVVIADKPRAVVLQHVKPKPERVEFAEVFGYDRQTTGEHIAIIRAWMRKNRLPQIDEAFSIAEFASVFERFVKPRCYWRHFFKNEQHEARQFLEGWARALLPQIMKNGD